MLCYNFSSPLIVLIILLLLWWYCCTSLCRLHTCNVSSCLKLTHRPDPVEGIQPAREWPARSVFNWRGQPLLSQLAGRATTSGSLVCFCFFIALLSAEWRRSHATPASRRGIVVSHHLIHMKCFSLIFILVYIYIYACMHAWLITILMLCTASCWGCELATC